MTLKEYLKLKGMAFEDFVRMTTYGFSYLSKVHAGARAGRKAANEIERLTEGMVKAKDLMNQSKTERVKTE